MKRCALVIGHKKSSPGASNKSSGLTEFAFNEAIAIEIESEIDGVDVQKISRRTYTSLPADINELNPDFIMSLHCNAFNENATGTEVLYYHRSIKGKLAAEILKDHLINALGLSDRGIKPKTSEDRGGYLLRYTNAPCVIAEPFFIDNDSDLQIVTDRRKELIKAYATSIKAIASTV
jgi:N-acetylmuramoyl-L-alanine amidase